MKRLFLYLFSFFYFVVNVASYPDQRDLDCFDQLQKTKLSIEQQLFAICFDVEKIPSKTFLALSCEIFKTFSLALQKNNHFLGISK